MQFDFMIYGSYGYTGTLVLEGAVERGFRPLIAGRDGRKLSAQREKYGIDGAVFSLAGNGEMEAAFSNVPLVLNCAGPFVLTAPTMAGACLRSGIHYVDITGEIRAIQQLAELDQAARSRGVMISPGMGFDVVPGDCLACHLKESLPSATHLSLAFRSRGRPSRGTIRSAIMHADTPGMVREDGLLREVPAGSISRRIDFGDGPEFAVAIPWGELASAYYSTGIPNIVTYMAAARSIGLSLTLAGRLKRLLAAQWVQACLTGLLRFLPRGPGERRRGRGSTRFWGEASDGEGRHVEARLAAVEAYRLTVEAVLSGAERILAGQVYPGFKTPGMAFGAEFAASLPGVSWMDS